jgi:hypothetical protein
MHAAGCTFRPRSRHDARVHAFGVPAELKFHFCIPLGYPAEGARFGGSRHRPTRETTYLDHWGAPVPWT